MYDCINKATKQNTEVIINDINNSLEKSLKILINDNLNSTESLSKLIISLSSLLITSLSTSVELSTISTLKVLRELGVLKIDDVQ